MPPRRHLTFPSCCQISLLWIVRPQVLIEVVTETIMSEYLRCVSCVAAMASNRGIGNKGKLPWPSIRWAIRLRCWAAVNLFKTFGCESFMPRACYFNCIYITRMGSWRVGVANPWRIDCSVNSTSQGITGASNSPKESIILTWRIQ